jgi:hypothetical protein
VVAKGASEHRKPTQPDFYEFLKTARDRFRVAAEAESEIRSLALDDLRFYAGEQWPLHVITERERNNRPCEMANRLPQFAKQIINEQRAARPAIQVNPVGDGADVDTAHVMQGLCRHIEIQSNAEVAYDVAFERAVIHGFGYIVVRTGFIDETSFDQELKIDRVEDPFAIYIDPSCKELDYSDADYAFIVSEMPRDRYTEKYPRSEVIGLDDFRATGDGDRGWISSESIRVAEYYHVEREHKTLVQLVDGRALFEDELDDFDQVDVDETGKPKTREVEVKTVHCDIINAREKLEEGQWVGKTIPIVPVLGDDLIVDGQRRLFGIVRYAKGPQRMYNYARTAVVEQLALASRAPWIVATGQIEGREEEWRQANTRNMAVLQYKPTSIAGQPVGPPIRNTFEPPIHGLTIALQQSENDLKAVTGIYDASLGAPGPEQSGKAILARQKEGEQANSNFMDNMYRSILRVGRILLECIPKVYDVPRTIRLVDAGGAHSSARINETFLEQGIVKLFDVTAGRYDVTISVGASHQSKRQEFVQAVLALVQAAPQVMSVVMDLLVRNMDWPGAREIADRLQKMLPPQLQESSDDAPPVPPEAQQKIAELMQQNAQLIQQLEASTDELRTKRLELESKERIALLNSQTEILKSEIASKSGEMQVLAKLDHAAVKHTLQQRQEQLHFDRTVEADAAKAALDAKVKLAKQPARQPNPGQRPRSDSEPRQTTKPAGQPPPRQPAAGPATPEPGYQMAAAQRSYPAMVRPKIGR